MKKQDYPEEIFRILELSWDKDVHTTAGAQSQKQAWVEVYEKLKQWEDSGIISIARGLEKFKKS